MCHGSKQRPHEDQGEWCLYVAGTPISDLSRVEHAFPFLLAVFVDFDELLEMAQAADEKAHWDTPIEQCCFDNTGMPNEQRETNVTLSRR